MAGNTYDPIILAFQLGVALFCANQLFLHQRNQRIYVPLALFFAAQTINFLVGIIDLLWGQYGYEVMIARWGSITLPATLAQPLLFWLYVRALTSEDGANRIAHKGWHALPLVLSLIGIPLMFMLPRSAFEQDILDFNGFSLLTQSTFIYVQVVAIVFYGQLAVYLFLTMRMMSAYRARLKDLFATTENRELSWIWWITTTVSAYLLLSVGQLGVELSGLAIPQSFLNASDLMDRLVSVAITWVIAIWGVRQQPGLMREPMNGKTFPERSEETKSKYERSALTDEHAKRIAGKIEQAMIKDLLYRDPNLSLWDLAKHIKVTSNYVSQTLNTTLRSNFFDYVNKWRIQDAVKQLHDTEETILVIAYDVGFNSRSSFYNAFKREMGTTPSALRARAS
ncbi:AraC family transcriptional regulator [Rhodophyticola sp. CCM32]|uniref:helix-turn-helix domain-containing protein n=1 Tax=Rhodophyticola sp. CCM32 TaxID=2916397 RepID=UPI00107F8E09|nr:AraC family transcriptional regulator [Rhodophyticola sp. CCM32]QBY01943.1 AraC family transcriptional regulator [Rhodophyticola sp. CCM32]